MKKMLFVLLACVSAGCSHVNYYVEKNLEDIERREQYIYANDDLTIQLKRLILEGKVAVGMNRSEVRASKGLPVQAERISCRMYGMDEYCLDRWNYSDEKIIFRNGILIKSY